MVYAMLCCCLKATTTARSSKTPCFSNYTVGALRLTKYITIKAKASVIS